MWAWKRSDKHDELLRSWFTWLHALYFATDSEIFKRLNCFTTDFILLVTTLIKEQLQCNDIVRHQQEVIGFLSDVSITDEDKAVHLAAEFVNHLRSELKHGEMYRHDKSQMPIPEHMTTVMADVSLKKDSRKELERLYLTKDDKDYHIKSFTVDLTDFAQDDQNAYKTELYSDFIERARNLIVPLKADWQESLDATEKTDLLEKYDLKPGSDLDKIHNILGTDITQHKMGFDIQNSHMEQLKQVIVDKDAEIKRLSEAAKAEEDVAKKDAKIKKLNEALKEMAKALASNPIDKQKYPNYRRRPPKTRYPEFKRRPYIRVKPLTFEEFEARREAYKAAAAQHRGNGAVPLPADFTLAHRKPSPSKEWVKKNKKNELTFDEYAKQKTGGGKLNTRKRYFGSKATSWEDIQLGREYDVNKRKKREDEAITDARDLAHKIYRSERSKRFENDFQQMWLLSPDTTRMWCSYHICRAQCAVSSATKCDGEDEQVRQVHIACAVSSEITDKNAPLYTIAEAGKESCKETTSTTKTDDFQCDEATLLCAQEPIPIGITQKVKNFFAA
uniref:Uncharacterized protein n=1 Tax=Ditylenchus dipsaci TaxID=166011 RepID=A0A915EJG8_9BILA